MVTLQFVKYHESTTYTCNAGYAVNGTTAQACTKTASVKCALHGSGVAVLPILPSDHCVPAPCGRYTPLPDNSRSDQVEATGVHDDVINITCNPGYRTYSTSQAWTECSSPRTFTVTCNDCMWQDAGLTCKKVRQNLALLLGDQRTKVDTFCPSGKVSFAKSSKRRIESTNSRVRRQRHRDVQRGGECALKSRVLLRKNSSFLL